VDFIETQGDAFPTFSIGDRSMDFSEAEDEATFKLRLAMGDAPLTVPGFAWQWVRHHLLHLALLQVTNIWTSLK
jgi:hypothetical protein